MNSIKKNGILLLLLLFSVGNAVAQSISGNVKDKTGIPLPGVNVIVDGTTKGAVTDFDGNYAISNLENGAYTLSATFIGYAKTSKTVTIDGGDLVVDFTMEEDAQSLDEIIVTGVVNPKSRLESSVSVSTMGAKLIEQAAPRSAGELFRNVPGIRAESSGGEGNANFNVRGVPVSSGGSRYFQIQEDGLPLNLFGDTSFGNADNFLRIDSNIGRVEAIRGGSASTQTSNGPAGIINMISKTGATEGGSLATTFGLDYQTTRLDFEYGTPLGNGLSYHIGGFMRTGEGPREIGYQGNKGGQFKANLTKKFENGYVRTYVKFLNDKSVMYMPMPMRLEGDNSNPTYSNLPGFDITSDATHSAYLQQSAGTSPFSGERHVNDVRNGNNPISKALGAEFSFDLGEGWKVTGKGRYSNNSGEWVAPFTAAVGTVSEIEGMLTADNDVDDPDRLDEDGNPDPYTGKAGVQSHIGEFATAGDVPSLVYANGDREAFAPSNGLAQVIHMFDVSIEDLSNFFGDIKISKKVSDNVGVTAGLFTATQNTKIGWQWNSFLSEVKGDGEARLADFDGVSRSGQYSYGTPVWGNCCQRKYNTVHSVNSPYVGVDADINDKLNFDGSVRFENVRVNGNIQGGPTSQGNFDYDGNGTIESIEETVPLIIGNAGQPLNDDYNFVSYSLGLNYKLNDGAAVFGRYSSGASGRAADRNNYGTNGLADVQYDELSQLEVGFKKRLNNGTLNLTGFSSRTDEGLSNELNRSVGNPFKALGLEAETALAFGENFNFNGSFTWTKAEIDGGANKGNTPRRQADLVYNLSPAYNFGADREHSVALSVLGTSKSYAQDDNDLVMPAYAYFNLIGRAGLTKGLSVVLSINNLFDTVGITEVEGNGDGAFGNDRLVRARSISGRSSTLSLQYKF
ncbi:TonB-dependent receptor [Algibacter amylolyticus]|uniref:TonB-dependent receptor n=1 Tax=Algibacter amylolyticus TaxID=1608400 RepID=A0A5M7BG01_9FLAO|nr:TonB-dependent receptor [Algibacter amylolyticus]KAA5827780.1 TonB-dependent receptor plug domain-containing protein [Algibacter amylolyticus]MBB5267007.1 outer membrane receptor protein involved in Fe transport [Algibacter amylolyticus]TSJ82025.1 TonB-dependent receptor [Algibacter amylolyticus]